MQANKKPIRSKPQRVVRAYVRMHFPIPFSRWMQLLLGFVFLFAAFAKGYDIVRFGRQTEAIIATIGIERTPLLGAFGLMVAIMIIILELYIGASLVSGYDSTRTTMSTVLVLIGFSGVALWIYMRHAEIDCGCFGAAVSRSARDTLAGDIVLLVMAIIGAMSKYASTKGGTVTRLIVVAGVIWTGLLFYFPQAGASVREGSIMPRSKVSSFGGSPHTRYIWLFNPDCDACQKLTPVINKISASAPDCLIAISAAGRGKLDEFEYDYKPVFKMRELPAKTVEELGLQDGTLIRIGQGSVDRIWPPYLLKPMIQLGIAK